MGVKINASLLRKALRRVPDDLAREVEIGFKRHGVEFEKRYIDRHWGAQLSAGKNSTTDRMASRSPGGLRQSLNTQTYNRGGGPRGVLLRATIGSARTAAYIQVQEKGATIRGNPWLAVPLPATLTAAGRPRYTSPRSLMDDPTVQTFVQRSKAGNLIIFRKDEDGITPLWVLKRSVKVPARLNFRKYLLGRKMTADRITRINAAVGRALSKNFGGGAGR